MSLLLPQSVPFAFFAYPIIVDFQPFFFYATFVPPLPEKRVWFNLSKFTTTNSNYVAEEVYKFVKTAWVGNWTTQNVGTSRHDSIMLRPHKSKRRHKRNQVQFRHGKYWKKMFSFWGESCIYYREMETPWRGIFLTRQNALLNKCEHNSWNPFFFLWQKGFSNNRLDQEARMHHVNIHPLKDLKMEYIRDM